MQSWENLIVWQVADALALEVYRSTENFPTREMYGLTSQLRRAAVSIPINIAEGCGRQNRNETRQFANIALGSLQETRYLLRFTRQLNYLEEMRYKDLIAQTARLGSLLWKFHESLK